MPEIAEKQVRVRLAPSPTGPLHVGTARTALFNWLFARQNGGVFIVRIEDTDKDRSEKKYEDDLLEGLTWLGIDWDEGPKIESRNQNIENRGRNKKNKSQILDTRYCGQYGPYRQSERTEIYKKYLKKLLNQGDAYYCYCTKEDLEAERQEIASRGLPPKYNGHCKNLTKPPAGKKPEVIRFKVPETKVEFKDLIRGKVVFDAELFGDIVIAKDIETPLYNFAVVVDDAEMKISHVIRGEDHLSNTPKQILMQKALGFPEPVYAHLPLILNPDKSKMSKRFADVALSQYRENGYLPEVMLNFTAFLGWHPKDNQEIFSKKDLIREFDITRVQKSGAIFNQEKLDWLNGEYLKKMDEGAIADILMPMLAEKEIQPQRDFLKKIISVLQTRAATIRDFVDMGNFFFVLPDYEKTLLIWKDATKTEVKSTLKEIAWKLAEVPDDAFLHETLSRYIAEIIGIRKRGDVLWPLRVALSGLVSSPDPILIMEVLGKDESLRRVEIAIQKLE